MTGLTQQTASATSYVHWASEGLCIGSMSFLGSSTYTCLGSTNPEIGAQTGVRCAQDMQVYSGTLYYRNKCCCGVSAQDCECSKSLGPERTEVQYIQRCQGWRMGALRGSTQRLCDKAPEPPRKRGQGTQRRCRDDSGRARRAWNCSMQSVKNAAMARSVPHAIEILLLRH